MSKWIFELQPRSLGDRSLDVACKLKNHSTKTWTWLQQCEQIKSQIGKNYVGHAAWIKWINWLLKLLQHVIYRCRHVDIRNSLAIDRDIVELLQLHRVTYFGHESLMHPERYPYILLCGYVVWSRLRRKPRIKWIDNIKEDCSHLEMTCGRYKIC